MKRNSLLRKDPLATLLTALSLIASSQVAFSFYNPGSGRWLTRDPVDETGGINLYVFCANSPAGHVDALGHCTSGQCSGDSGPNCVFTVTDLGQHPPIPIPPGNTNAITGKTTLTSWVFSTELQKCNNCSKKVVVRACWGAAKYWWYNQDDKTHEETHANIWRGHYEDLVSDASGYIDTCVSDRKASCYQSVITALNGAYFTDAVAANAEFDFSEYGQLDPGVCAKAQSKRAEANAKWADVAVKEARCAAR